jgi:hypothetical protein
MSDGLREFILTNVRTAGKPLTREDLLMATDNKVYNDKGLDSSRETNPQSPLNRSGEAQTQQSLGTVQTGFKATK